jgi:hypothetical protein
VIKDKNHSQREKEAEKGVLNTSKTLTVGIFLNQKNNFMAIDVQRASKNLPYLAKVAAQSFG